MSLKDNDKITAADGKTYSVKELQESHRIQKSQTPKGDITWYIKWCASIITLFAVSIRASGIQELHWLDMLGSWIGALGWCVVGVMWKDRALIILNGVIGVVLFSGLLKLFFS
jgi:hypothetical protein